VLALHDPRVDYLLVVFQKDEADSLPGADCDLPVGAPEVGTGDDAGLVRAQALVNSTCDRLQPGHPVGVIEWAAGTHLLDIRWRIDCAALTLPSIGSAGSSLVDKMTSFIRTAIWFMAWPINSSSARSSFGNVRSCSLVISMRRTRIIAAPGGALLVVEVFAGLAFSREVGLRAPQTRRIWGRLQKSYKPVLGGEEC